MIFADLFFVYFFFPLCLGLYFLTKKIKYRNIVLIAFSLVFYAWGEPKWVFILLISSVINYYAALAIDKNKGQALSKTFMILITVYDLGVLFAFKYISFFISNFDSWFGLSIPVPQISLPIGISFYTFQTLSYVIDVYRGDVPVQKDYPKLLLYISLFPQLVAGPIVRYATIAEEIDRRKTTVKDVSEGISRIMLGIGKKVIIANSISTIVTALFGEFKDGYAAAANSTVLGNWYGAVLVGMWYYFDFSGYSDMAIGMGRIFGFHFDENFKYPYICTSITEFWRRWHISLSSWFRDYVYIPLGGNRKGKTRQCVNIMIVWALTGFWHGASWNFMIWGLYFGVLLLIEKLLIGKWLSNTHKAVQHIYAVALVAIGWGIFYFEDFKSLGRFFKSLIGFAPGGFTDLSTNSLFTQNIWLFIAAAVLCTPIIPKIKKSLCTTAGGMKVAGTLGILLNLAILFISSMMLVNTTNNPFLYFKF
ncbi:MAG: MBOAT family protein [Ruminococcus sp.]|nr:MBOAT family protein [Ruminococcus sp.]